MNYSKNINCSICKSAIDIEYLDLNDQPLANSYHKGEALEKFPLRMQLCTNCWHSQLSISVDPKIMFDHYFYVSDTTLTLTDYFRWATDYILENNKSSRSVLEIACNSGIFLEMFQKKGLTCYGVDPAQNLRHLSYHRNLEVYVDYWNQSLADKFFYDNGNVDIILAFNVLGHVNNPNEFIAACKTVLSDTGRIYIQTSQCNMLLNNEFDVIYHEHHSYFTAKSIKKLSEQHDLYVSSITKTDIHGTSYMFSFQKNPCDESQILDLIQWEEEKSYYKLSKYQDFAQQAHQIKKELIKCLDNFRNQGYTLIGYGAAAKGNTLLNFIDYKLDYIIDDNPLKVGYQTPGTNIEIHSSDMLQHDFQKICFIPLAWNFFKEIKKRIQEKRNSQDDVFIRYFPNVYYESNQ